MIVPPSPAHAARANVIRYDVTVVGEPFLTEGADAILRRNLSVHQLPHLSIRTDLPISARVLGIVNATDSQSAVLVCSLKSLPCRSRIESGELGTVDFDGVSCFPPVWIFGGGINADLR